MRKLSWWNKPITWGASITASLIGMAVVAIGEGIWYAVEFVDWDNVKAKLKKRKEADSE